MPCALSETGSEGVHRDDDADGGQQTGTGERDGEQRHGERGSTEQVGAEDGRTDHQRRVDRRLEADREAGQDHGGRTGARALADALDRLVLGAGVVAGEGQDAGRHHDAEDDGGGRDEPRVTLGAAEVARDVAELAEAARQVDVGRDHAGHGGDGRGQVEGPVDGLQAVLAGLGAGEVDADDRGERADRGDQEREDQALVTEGLRAEDQRGHERDGVGLEQVRSHAGAVADVVAHVVGDGRGVARVVLGDVVLDLADEVGADVGRLGEDAAADTHEHREQRGTEAEALEHVRGGVLEGEDDDAGTEQAEADGQHADHGTGPEADRHGGLAPGGLGGRRDAQVGAHREVHAEVADGGREARADDEEDGAEDPHRHVVSRQQEQREERDDREDAERAELPRQVGVGAFLHGLGDVLHVVGAFTGSKDFLAELERHPESAERDQEDDEHQHEVATGELHDSGSDPGHVFPPGSDSHLMNEAESTQRGREDGTPV